MPFFILTSSDQIAPTRQGQLPLARLSIIQGGSFDTYATALESAQSRWPTGGYTIVEAPHATVALLVNSGVRFAAPLGGWPPYAPFFDLAQELGRQGHDVSSPQRWSGRIADALLGAQDRGPGKGPLLGQQQEGYDPRPALRNVLVDLQHDSAADQLHLHERLDQLLRSLDTIG